MNTKLQKTQKQRNELEDFNKLQNETKEIIKKKRDKLNKEDSKRYERGEKGV
jgi:hypothetical protein